MQLFSTPESGVSSPEIGIENASVRTKSMENWFSAWDMIWWNQRSQSAYIWSLQHEATNDFNAKTIKVVDLWVYDLWINYLLFCRKASSRERCFIHNSFSRRWIWIMRMMMKRSFIHGLLSNMCSNLNSFADRVFFVSILFTLLSSTCTCKPLTIVCVHCVASCAIFHLSIYGIPSSLLCVEITR